MEHLLPRHMQIIFDIVSYSAVIRDFIPDKLEEHVRLCILGKVLLSNIQPGTQRLFLQCMLIIARRLPMLTHRQLLRRSSLGTVTGLNVCHL